MLRMSGANKKQEAARKARLEREAAERAAAERSKRLKLLGGAGVAIVVIVSERCRSSAFSASMFRHARSKLWHFAEQDMQWTRDQITQPHGSPAAPIGAT